MWQRAATADAVARIDRTVPGRMKAYPATAFDGAHRPRERRFTRSRRACGVLGEREALEGRHGLRRGRDRAEGLSRQRAAQRGHRHSADPAPIFLCACTPRSRKPRRGWCRCTSKRRTYATPRTTCSRRYGQHERTACNRQVRLAKEGRREQRPVALPAHASVSARPHPAPASARTRARARAAWRLRTARAPRGPEARASGRSCP